MTLQIHNIGEKKKHRKLLGRGNSSGHGTTSGKGQKGQNARSGVSGLKFKGLKKTLLSSPKFKGMKSPRPKAQVVKLTQLEKHFKDGDSITPGVLFEKNLVKFLDEPVKILSDKNEIKIKLEIFGCLISGSAKAAVEKAGGKIIDITGGEDKIDAGEKNQK